MPLFIRFGIAIGLIFVFVMLAVSSSETSKLKAELAAQKSAGWIVECLDQGEEDGTTKLPGYVCAIRPIKTAPVDIGQ